MPTWTLPYTIGDPAGWEWYMLAQAICGSFYATPQIYRIYKTKSVRDVSIYTWALAAVLNVTWSFYGLSLQDVVVTVSSVLACIFATVISIQWCYITYHWGHSYHSVPPSDPLATIHSVTRIPGKGLLVQLHSDATDADLERVQELIKSFHLH